MDEALYRQIGGTLRSQILILMGDSDYPAVLWRDNTTRHKQSRRFLECVDDNFLLQVIEEPMRKGAMLDLILTNKEKFLENVKVKRNLSCSDHELVEFKILRAEKRAYSKVSVLDFRKANWPFQGSSW